MALLGPISRFYTSNLDKIEDALKSETRYFHLSDAMPVEDWELAEITADKSKIGRTSVFMLERMTKTLQPLFVPYASFERTLTASELRK